jgi:hypothetical protein
MLAEVQKYIDVTDALNEAYTTAHGKLNRDYNEGKITYFERNELFRPMSSDHRAKMAAAAIEPTESVEAAGADDVAYKQAKFIMDVVWEDNAGNAIEVLKILPATSNELHALRREHSWCDEFLGYYDRAVDAGLIPGITAASPVVAARRSLDRYMSSELYRGTAERITSLVNAIVTAEVEAAKAQAFAALNDAADEIIGKTGSDATPEPVSTGV